MNIKGRQPGENDSSKKTNTLKHTESCAKYEYKANRVNQISTRRGNMAWILEQVNSTRSHLQSEHKEVEGIQTQTWAGRSSQLNLTRRINQKIQS